MTMPLPLPEVLYQQLELTFILLWHKRHNQDAKVMWLLNEIRRLYHRNRAPGALNLAAYRAPHGFPQAP